MRGKGRSSMIVAICWLLVLLLGIFATESWVDSAYHYKRLNGVTAAVAAEITAVEQYDTEGATDYIAYVSYTYNGETYTDIRYDAYAKPPKIGKIITVELDPQDPTFFLPEKPDIFWLFFFPIMFLIPGSLLMRHSLSVAIGCKKAAKQWPTVYGGIFLNGDVVCKDLIYANRIRAGASLIVSGCLVVLFAGICCVNYLRFHLGAVFLPYGLALIPVLIGVRNAHMAYNKTDKPNIELIADTIESKVTEDDDETITHYFMFSKMGKWEHDPDIFVDVKETVFHELGAGDQVILAVDDRREILRVFSAKDFCL